MGEEEVSEESPVNDPEGVTCGQWAAVLLFGTVALGAIYLLVRFVHWAWITPMTS